MAKNAIAPQTRADCEAQEKVWRGLAQLLEVVEKDWEGQPRRATGKILIGKFIALVSSIRFVARNYSARTDGSR